MSCSGATRPPPTWPPPTPPAVSTPPRSRECWAQPGTVQVIFAHWVEPAAGESAAALVSEARVQPVDRRARLRMRTLWTVVARFERLIGGEALQVAVRRAEGA